MDIPVTHAMYFVAIMCPPRLDQYVKQFKYRMRDQFGSVAALKSPAHITIIPPFWLDLDKERQLQETLEAFGSERDELIIQLDGFSAFGKRVLFIRVLENPELEEIKKQVEQHFAGGFGDLIPKDERPFHPHITIANRDLKPGDFEKAWLYFSDKNYKKNFSSRTISLLKLTEGNWKVIAEKSW
jgi:2'-5' RNA ligase